VILKSSTTGSVHLLWVQPRAQRDDPEIAWTIARIGNPQLNPPCPSSSGGSSSSDSGGFSAPSSGSEPSDSGGSGGGGGNCLLYGTLVRLADGRLVPVERLRPGEEVASLDIAGLARDADWKAQYDWRTPAGIDAVHPRTASVGRVRHGRHDGFFVINGRVKTTFEHPFLIRRGGQTGFCSAELLRVGDRLVRHDLADEPIASIERVQRTVRTIALHVPGTNVYLADGVWVHNDAESETSSSGPGSGSGGASSSSSKSSGSSFGGSESGSDSSSGSSTSVPF